MMPIRFIFAAVMFATNVAAQAPVPSTQQLDQLVDRIALYPDDLIAIILPAATVPLQLVQADRYLDKRKADPKLPVDAKWDDAVKSLLNYPEVVKTMSGDLDWTTALGEAVVADQGAVLEAIQTFRRKTQAAGNLKSDPKQTIVVEKNVIQIVPANPQVIYVPQYNPATVIVAGTPWGYYPAPYPVYYYPYPPGAAFATGLIWGAALGAAWNGNHYHTNYGGYGGSANININNSTNINTGNINTGNINRGGSASTLPAGGSTQWNPSKQPGQVSGRPSTGRVGNAPSGGGGYGSVAARPSTQPAGGGAFGGYGSGRQAQMDSSRGQMSRGSSISGPGAGQVPRSSGVGSVGRAGGGGGTRGGGVARGGRR